MEITLYAIGKTDSPHVGALVDDYTARLRRYCRFRFEVVPDQRHTKHMDEDQQREKEGAALLKRLDDRQNLWLWDERGETLDSIGFARRLERWTLDGGRPIAMAIGGPYGFSEEVRARARGQLALSRMTFPHQLVRALILEQVYRGFTILRNEPYHHR